MMKAVNYIVEATVSRQEFIFEYDANGVWEALIELWHEDYPEILADVQGNGRFPISVLALEKGKVIKEYSLWFDAALFRAFYDKGHKADGLYTLDEFCSDICRNVSGDNDNVSNTIAVWSDWCMGYDDEDLWLDYMVKHPKGHTNRQHLQEKWDHCYDKYGSKAAMHMFWRELDNDNRTILTEYITTQWQKN